MLESLTRELGGVRTSGAWRLLGFALFAIGALILTQDGSFSGGGWEVALATASGLLLTLLGGRVIVLALTAAAVATLLARILGGQLAYQLAEEYLPIAVLTGAGAASALWTALRRQDSAQRGAEIESIHLALMRLAMLLMMGFAVLHKTNSDFLDPQVSCATAHAQVLLGLVPRGEVLARFIPGLALAGEAMVPILLIFAPRVGVPYSVGLMTYVGHRGATPFTMLVMALACAFLAEADTLAIREAVRRRWRWGAGLLLAVLAASIPFHAGLADWGRYGPFQLCVVGLLFAIGVGLLPVAWQKLADSIGALRRWLLTPLWRFEPLLPAGAANRALLALLLFAGLVNGLTPYAGSKFRMSFAMFSNLRVDAERWNSLVVPSGVTRREHDAQLLVLPDAAARGAGAALAAGLYSPRSLSATLASLRAHGASADLTIRYAGEERRFRDAARSSALHEWLGTLPSAVLFRDTLSAGGPQYCVH